MAKKIVAKTRISHGMSDGKTVEVQVGEEVDPKKLELTKEQLTQLYEAGAVEVQETKDEKVEEEETPSTPPPAPKVIATPETPAKK